MTILQNKLRQMRLFDLMRQRGVADGAAQKLRISRLSDGETEHAVLLRRLAARSLTVPHSRRV